MKKFLTTLLMAGLLLGLLAAPSAASNDNGKQSGCKGVEQALGQANAKGKAALLDVANKLGCGEVTPEAVDVAACAPGSVSLGRHTYTGTLGAPYEHGWPTWTGSWSTVSGSGAWPTYGDAGGFYWEEAVPGSVATIVVVSFTDERVVLDAGLHPTVAVSQNVLTDRTGMNHVNFCA